MSTRYAREGYPSLPRHYRWPVRRPGITYPGEILQWDLLESWPTAREHLAWLRRTSPARRGGRASYLVWNGLMPGRWVPEPRPQIRAHFIHWTTRRANGFGRLAKAEAAL